MHAIRQHKRQFRQNVSAFAALRAAPAAVAVTLPAGGLFALVAPAGTAGSAAAATVAGASARTLAAPVLAAGTRHNIGRLERGSVVTLSAGFDLYMDVGLGNYQVIAEGA